MFGGNPNVSHFAVGVRYMVRDKDGNREGHSESRERRLAERAKLKASGIKTEKYFQYYNNDAAGKAKAKAAANKEAKRINKLTGVIMDVAEGCFL